MIKTSDLMISYVRVYIIAGLILLSFNAESQNYRLEKAWETEPVFSTPESAVFDANRDQIYISNYNTFPRDLESADDFISVLDLNGNILKLKWIRGVCREDNNYIPWFFKRHCH